MKFNYTHQELEKKYIELKGQIVRLKLENNNLKKMLKKEMQRYKDFIDMF